MKKKKKRRIRKKILGLLVLILMLMVAAAGAYLFIQIRNNKTSPYYLAGDYQYVEVLNEEHESVLLARGSQVDIKNKKEDIDGTEYRQFELDGNRYFILDDSLAENRNDCVRETVLYALRDHVLTENYDNFYITGWVFENDELTVDSYHELMDDGTVDYYKVNGAGYISGRYVAKEFYQTYLDAGIYRDVYYRDGGDPQQVRYYPKDDYDTGMPEVVKALYINAEAIADVDSFLALAARTGGINAFVVDIKDCYVDTQLAYDSPVAMHYAPSTENIPNTYESYRNNVQKIKDAGYYLIGRITAFKDDAFASDNPDEALMYQGRMYNYGYVKWPSIFSRKMWEYDLALAEEAATKMGFDEIQFDYIRLPEDVEDVDLRNTYGESRVQGVTNFLRYVTEYLHGIGVNVSADVFGETSGDDEDRFSCFVTSYGQFWPAISNTVDAISSMPYPDHFSAYAYGIESPWYYPGELMYSWGRATYYAQQNTYDPAKCRTWIMAQNSDVYDVVYDADFLEAQIDGLKDAGVFDGYLTWNAASSLRKYETYIDVFY